MVKLVSMSNVSAQRKLMIESKIADITREIDSLDEKRNKLLSKKEALELQIFTPRERAEMAVRNKAKKINW